MAVDMDSCTTALKAPEDDLWLLSEAGSLSSSDIETRGVQAPFSPPSLPRRVTQMRDHVAKPVNKILFLDGLRGLAAMLVVVNHSGYIKEHNMGAPAVDTFFVLSAFLLTLIFEKKARQLFKQQASYHRWGLALADYFARRFLRVYPLFAIVATVLAVLPDAERARSLKMNHPEKYSLWKVLTFSHDSRPHILWSLPVEIGYYFLIPVIVISNVRAGKLWWLLVSAGYGLVFYNGFFLWPARRKHISAWPHHPTLLCGSLAAMVYTKMDEAITRRGFVWEKRHTYALRAVELAFLTLLVSGVFDGLLFDYVVTNPLPDANHFVSFSVTVLILCEMLVPGPISSVLEWSLLRYAGKISFSMYLLHIFVVYADFLTRASYYNRFILLWTVVFLLSTVSYHVVEPCQRFAATIGKWIKQKDIEVMNEPANKQAPYS